MNHMVMSSRWLSVLWLGLLASLLCGGSGHSFAEDEMEGVR